MKTRERTVHFYDVALSSHTQKKGIANASCTDLGTLLQAMTALSPRNTKVFDGKVVQVRLADWQKDASSGCYQLLLNRADRDVSDVTFRDFKRDTVRNGGKTTEEGLGRVNTNSNRDDCARKSPTWRSRPNNSPPLNTACPGSVATSA